MAAPKPTLLAFHGGGSNAMIHTVQLARLSRLLRPTFDIVSVEAPFVAAAGPGVLPFFEGLGPYKRWLVPAEKPSTDNNSTQSAPLLEADPGRGLGGTSSVMPPEVESVIREEVQKIQAEGSKVVGLIGFSQGTRVVAGLLKGAEIVNKVGGGGKKNNSTDWLSSIAFGISVCGSYPPPLIPASASALLSELPPAERQAIEESKIEIPTLHAQGKQDEWAWAGKLLIDGVYEVEEGKSVVLELEMGHHYPVQAENSERIRDWAVDTYHDSIAR